MCIGKGMTLHGKRRRRIVSRHITHSKLVKDKTKQFEAKKERNKSGYNTTWQDKTHEIKTRQDKRR
jgi:hypothetical protein